MNSVTSGYGEMEIIHNVSIEVKDQEIITIIGPNGAGKSTLMKTVFGLAKFVNGSILYKETEISQLRPDQIVKLGISYVPQEKNVFPSLTVSENLEMGAFTSNCSFDDFLEDVIYIFPELKDMMHRKAGTMSGGEQKMVAVSRALVIKPSLMLLDEPSSALSPKLMDVVFTKIKQINEMGTAIMIIEQNAKKALSISDRGYILEMGKNKFEGAANNLLENPDIVKLYLGATNPNEKKSAPQA
jgi:ABC-type branched-subunit amino acid transport system ATPase component